MSKKTTLTITKAGKPTTPIAFKCRVCECEWHQDIGKDLQMGLQEAFGRYAIKCPNCFNLGVLADPPQSEPEVVPEEAEEALDPTK